MWWQSSAAGLILMRIKRSLREICANYLLKKLAVAYVLTRKSMLATLLKLSLKLALFPPSQEDGGCFAGFPKPLGLLSGAGSRCGRGIDGGGSGVIQVQSVQFQLFQINTSCLLKVFWSLGVCDRTAEQLISRFSPRVHPLIRSQIQHVCLLCPNSQHLLSE